MAPMLAYHTAFTSFSTIRSSGRPLPPCIYASLVSPARTRTAQTIGCTTVVDSFTFAVVPPRYTFGSTGNSEASSAEDEIGSMLLIWAPKSMP